MAVELDPRNVLIYREAMRLLARTALHHGTPTVAIEAAVSTAFATYAEVEKQAKEKRK